MGSNRYARFLCTGILRRQSGRETAAGMGFYEKYIEAVTGNDVRTRSSVDAIMGRMDELLEDRPDGRLSGLVVGRVQSGKTRNYVGLALKAADAGYNVIIVLTSCNTALANQTEKRMKRAGEAIAAAIRQARIAALREWMFKEYDGGAGITSRLCDAD